MSTQYNSIINGVLVAITTSLIVVSSQAIMVLAQYSIVEPQLPTLSSQNQQTRNATSSHSTTTTSTIAKSNEITVAKDSVILLLEGKTIPANDFIPIYSTTHYVIIPGHTTIIGHIVAKLPCDTNSKSPIQLLLGRIPIIKVMQPNLVSELSTPGKMCLYQLDIGSKPGIAASEEITDVALKNSTNKAITFSPSSAVIISMDEVRPSGRS
ncbi:MAG TPA: hypothetical protein VE619_10675 [Nitrososphaeraceae archaeon]|nr:hypothetical protein [Nitrososphaeraceae archaeon]